MEKKIEKLEGSYDVPQLKQKLNEIIDYLNSQDQEEICTHDFDLNNRCTKCGVRGVKDMIAELQDTPEEKEEWEEGLDNIDLMLAMLQSIENCTDEEVRNTAKAIREELDKVSQLLSERAREAKQEVIDDIWEEARDLASWDEHDGVIPISQVENCLPEAIKNIEESLSKLLKEKENGN